MVLVVLFPCIYAGKKTLCSSNKLANTSVNVIAGSLLE